jgi:hypothetical protein
MRHHSLDLPNAFASLRTAASNLLTDMDCYQWGCYDVVAAFTALAVITAADAAVDACSDQPAAQMQQLQGVLPHTSTRQHAPYMQLFTTVCAALCAHAMHSVSACNRMGGDPWPCAPSQLRT